MAKAKILIADDDRDLVEILKSRLEVTGYETIAAYEGVRTIELAHKQKPDLILLDLRMPAGTGQTVLKNLRSRSETEKIPVIVLTAMPASLVEKEVREAGAQDFITKPYEPEILLKKIRELLPS